MRYPTLLGSCDAAGPPGAVEIAGGVANFDVPEQNSWAQIRTADG